MAQKEYEMQFQLNAKLGSQYNSTLRAAQSELTKFREEYRQLSTTANDTSAYQRQQTAVENTKSKLELLQQQYDNIQREIEETGSYSSDLENKLLAKQAQIDKTTAALQSQTDKLEDYKRKLEEAGVDVANLDNEAKRLKSELESLKSGFDHNGESAEEFGEKGKDAVSELGAALAAAGITRLVKEIYNAFAECVEIAADFEESMSTVEAISGATRSEIANLTEYAKDLGASTKFTAQEVSEGMSYMAMAGWETTDMLSGMDSVLALAAASGEDLGNVSDIVTDSLTAFGLKASDTARFADVLAATATNANTNVGMMGETFKYAAPVAGALGYSIEDVSVAIGLMANAGVKGSNAGTALRNVFNGLLEGVTLTGAAFGEYEYTAVNADGTMKDFGATLNDLRYYFNQMTDAERTSNAMTIAGQRGYAGLLAILNATEDDFNSLRTSIEKSAGAAQKMADIKLDNLNGQMTIAKSAAEGMQIAIGDQFTPVLTKMYQVLASVFSGVTEFINQYPILAKLITAVTVGVGAFVVGLTAYIVVSKLAKAATDALTAAMNANPFLLAGAAIAGVIVALTTLVAITGSAEEEQERLSSTAEAQRQHLEALRHEYEAVCDAEGEASEKAIQLKKRLDEETASFDTTKETMQEYLDRRQEVFDAYSNLEQEHSDEEYNLAKEFDVTSNLIGRLQELTEAEHQSAEAKKEIAAIVDVLNESIPDLGLAYDELTGKLNITPENLLAMAEQQYQRNLATERQSNLMETIAEVHGYEAQQREDQAQYDAAQRTLDNYLGESGYIDEHGNVVLSDWEHETGPKGGIYHSQYINKLTGEKLGDIEHSDLMGEAQQAANAVQEAKSRLSETNDQLSAAIAERDTLLSELTGYDAESAESGDAIHDVFNTYTERINALTDAYNTAYDAAYQSISGQYKLWDDVANVSASSVDDVIGNLEKQKEYWNDYNSNIQLLLGYSGQIEGLAEMVASFGDGSEESVNMIAGMAEAAKSGDLTKIQDLATAWQENKTAQDEAAQSMADLSTGYSVEMEKISSEIATDVAALDMSDEAVTAGENTIQGFIDGAKDMLPAVQQAYAGIGQAAKNALSGNTPIVPQRGYATGTKYAAPGAAYVGEDGPELIWFGGGETVMNANETAEYLRAVQNEGLKPVGATTSSSGNAVQISFAPIYNLSGASDADEIREVLAAHDEEMKQQIKEMLEEEAEDRIRRQM